MNKRKILIYFISKPVLGIIGFLMLSYYIWFRFIRDRVPRDIPFDEDYTSFILGYVEEPYPYVNIAKFIELQADNIRFRIYDIYEYKCYIKNYFIENKEIIRLSQECNDWIPIFVYNYIWLYIFYTPRYSKMRQQAGLFIPIIYFIIWMYILIVSLHTFHFSDLEKSFLQLWKDNYDPFSNLPNESIYTNKNDA